MKRIVRLSRVPLLDEPAVAHMRSFASSYCGIFQILT